MDYEKSISWNMPKAFNLKSEKKHHERKLLIIDLVNLCDDRMESENSFAIRNGLYANGLDKQVKKNISRYEKIKSYLLERYNRS